MKRFWWTLALCALPLMAQEETLFNHLECGGFGGPVVKLSQIKGDFAVLVGGRGGWIINHVFVLGGGGYGLANAIPIQSSGDRLSLGMGYGGLELAYIHDSDRLIHFSFELLLGGGTVYAVDRELEFSEDPEADGFWVVEPGANLELNVTSFFRITVGGSYRYIAGVDRPDVNNGDLDGPTFHIVFKFGFF